MPLFEYICKKCGKEFEKLIFSINNEKIECPDCRGTDIDKKFSTFSSKNLKNESHSCGSMPSHSCMTKKNSGDCGGCCGI